MTDLWQKQGLTVRSDQRQIVPTNRLYPRQQGIALIAVLMILILITLAGLMAARQSSTDLKTATADQINTLLLQTADGANHHLEQTINHNPTSVDYRDARSVSGMVHFFFKDPKARFSEYIYCYNQEPRRYLKRNATIMTKTLDAHGNPTTGVLSGLNSGVCDYKQARDYTSQRATALTQINVESTPITGNEEAFEHLVEGRDSESSGSIKAKMDVRTTSAIPSYNEPVGNGGGNCFALSAGGSNELLNCLKNASTPHKMIFSRIEVFEFGKTTVCVPYGNASSSGNPCVLTGI